MMIQLILNFAILIFLLILCNKFKLLIDKKTDKHKKFATSNNSHFIGGLFLLSLLIHYFLTQKDYPITLFLIAIFLIGFLADLKIFNNPKIRLIIQIFVLLIFIYCLEIKIPNTRIEIFDYYLGNRFINCLFTTFCLGILINGSNFVDGINTLLINYYIIILSLFLFFLDNSVIDYLTIQYLLLLLIVILLFNLLGKIILGDSGSYVLSLLIGTILIKYSLENQLTSPYFIILLLWYPCFELLFSMIRRFYSKVYSYQPDVLHLHQMLLKLVNNKFKFKMVNLNHLITASIINLYNLCILMIGVNYPRETKLLITLIIINMIIYIMLYIYMGRKLKLIQN